MTVDSIRDQTVRDTEIIVVDDGSTDRTPELMAWYAQEDARVQYIRFEDRGGAARCRNRGNLEASAMLIHVADAGDVYHPRATRVALDAWKKDEKLDIFYSSVVLINDKGQAIGNQEATEYKAGEKINFSHPSVVYTKAVAANHKYREVTKESDLYEAFFLEAALAGRKFGYDKKAYVMKRELGVAPDSRNLEEAHKFKREVYREFNIPWPWAEAS